MQVRLDSIIVMLSIITKVMHARMDKVCKAKGYYGEVQYGFISGRSMSFCVFILLVFCDIAQRGMIQ